MLSIDLVAYLALFILVGVLFLFVSLLIGRFIRPHAPSVQKSESYECGEPSVGSSFIQFDLRFYVVALLFIIFEVELAFFFPPAVVFGKLNQLRGDGFGPKYEQLFTSVKSHLRLTPAAKEKFGELGVPPTGFQRIDIISDKDAITVGKAEQALNADLQSLSLMALLDIGVFFIVLLVGFAYLWKQGDLNWVRAIARPAQENNKLSLLRQYGEGQ